MATPKPINTRILLRNDTLANWEASGLILGKGEVAIATLGSELAEVRVGTGSSTWATALKLNVNADQISGLVETIRGTSKKYQVVANGSNGNSWKLQEAALSSEAWSDVAGSTWTVDFTAINNQITALTSDVDSIKTDLAQTKTTLNTVSSDYLKAADKNELSDALTALDSAKLAKNDFATLSNEIGLSAARADNHVATQEDIAALDGVMHFKGVVSAVPTSTEGYEVGDVVLVSGSSTEEDNGKEFVLVEVDSVKKWEQIGDQAHYATKSYVDTGDANTLTTANAYTDGKITDISGTITTTYATKTELTSAANALSTDYNTKIGALSDAIDDISGDYATKTELTTLVGTTSAETLVSANAYADSKFAGLSDYYTKDEVNAISTALSTDYVGKIKAVDDKLADYALSADVTSLVNETSAATINTVAGQASDLSSADTVNGAKAYAKNYTDKAVAGLSADKFIKHGEVVDTDLSGFFILSCGGASLRQDEPTTPIA